MPTYSYHCDTCAHDFEAVQRFADDPLTKCPECEAPIRRVIQPVGVVFKGSGWYITDSRAKDSGGDSGSKSSASSAKSSADGKSISDSKSTSDGAEKPATPDTSAKSPAKVAD